MECALMGSADVYVDLYFMINFSMDFLCFFLCARILARKLSLLRTLLACAIGGVYATLALFSCATGALALAVDVGVCLLMCFIALWGKRSSAGATLVFSVAYFVVSMLLGGIMTGVFNLLNKLSLPLGKIESDGISVWILALLAVVSGVITLLGGGFFKKRSQIRRAEVDVTLFGTERSFSAIVDSGNLLRDPLSGKSVIVLDVKRCLGFLPREILRCAKDRGISRLGELPEGYADKIRLIPATSALGDGVMVALSPSSIIIKDGTGFHSADALVALSDIEGDVGAIVPVSLMS